MVKVLIIDPATRSVSEKDVPASGQRLGAAIAEIIGTDNLDHTSALAGVFGCRGLGCFVDGFGHFKHEITACFRIAGYGGALAGVAVIYREDMSSLEQPTIDHGLEIEDVLNRITWLRKVPGGMRDRFGIQEMEDADGDS